MTHPMNAARDLARLARETQMRNAIVRARIEYGDRRSLTAVQAVDTYSETVHLGWDYGSYESFPLCGALARRERETTDSTANCPRCARVLREIGMEYLIKDADGWTGIYRNY